MDKHWLEISFRDEWVSIRSLDYQEDLLGSLAELGVIELHGDHIHVNHVIRLHKFFRLRGNLGVNDAGAAIILDLLDRIERLQADLRSLGKE
ncbi:MAG: hypothetical protein KGZ79_14470 [Dethiobacter sp.]|jgi:MerR family transcriptional regulator/heat shock protein HspR|nr:hypothetical protein [Dethiobacter sp.]